jgi:hypothetical protein
MLVPDLGKQEFDWSVFNQFSTLDKGKPEGNPNMPIKGASP